MEKSHPKPSFYKVTVLRLYTFSHFLNWLTHITLFPQISLSSLFIISNIHWKVTYINVAMKLRLAIDNLKNSDIRVAVQLSAKKICRLIFFQITFYAYDYCATSTISHESIIYGKCNVEKNENDCRFSHIVYWRLWWKELGFWEYLIEDYW